MGKKRQLDSNGVRALLGLATEPEAAKPTPFTLTLAAVVMKAVAGLRAQGVMEIEEENLKPLVNEIVNRILEMDSLRRLPECFVNRLIQSDLVEEVYGTDAEISAALRPFLEEL